MPFTLSQHLLQPGSIIKAAGLRGSSPALVSALAAGPCCCILPDEHQVSLFEQDLQLFTDSRILIYPGYEIPPYTPLSPDQQTTAARLATLYSLLEHDPPFFLITSAEALMRRVMPGRILRGTAELILAGEDCDPGQLVTSLVRNGYEKVAMVHRIGDFSVRGGIVDIFPPPFPLDDGSLQEGPVRLDFFGDTIDSLRVFNPITQRSEKEIGEITILPVTDILFPDPESPACRLVLKTLRATAESHGWGRSQTEQIADHIINARKFPGMEFYLPLFYPGGEADSQSVFDFLPQDTRMVIVDPEACRQTVQLVSERIDANFLAAKETSATALPPARLFLDEAQIQRHISSYSRIACTDFSEEPGETVTIASTDHRLLKQEVSLQRRKRGLVAPLVDQILVWQKQGDRVILCCRSSRHTRNLAELLERHGLSISLLDTPLAQQLENLAASTLFLCTHSLQEGFSLPQHRLHLISESELFGEMRLGGHKKGQAQKGAPVRVAELNHGDVVVHRDHGLGYYQGLTALEFQGIRNDFMLIEYRDGDRLYLPVDRLSLVSRYEGLSDTEPRIDRLGSQSWKTVKEKVKAEVWKVAQELLEIYARREVREGRRFSPPAELYHELEESFPYDETPGQDKAITDVIADLISDRPMDRLVCGDVGYGKTEVAIRAAFKVVEDGFQVAILVPTTVLAEQHAHTFTERLQGFPVTVECINRFRSTTTQKRIVKDLAAGKIDIIIGTHRLLSKDVVYKNLGLLIVDEEHRFGVGHKEKIKQIKAEVDILTLTATPIPRTLQMSLLGIRDLSVISSPPENRRPVKTFVARYDELVIKEAIMKEMRRNGQVFIVHNRVRSIHRMAAIVQKLVPAARVGVAHGQMEGKELEAIMVSFVDKEIDVLICTTIIESGLDIPAANTIIINKADMLGLAEIYQLRGRVGRSDVQSYAYLLVPSVDDLSKDSKERLRALMDYNELGGGFKLAMSDLQIRGGGNLLGVSQSGHIAAIGYDLYLDLLQKTVADMKARISTGIEQYGGDDLDPEINLQISAYIPETYIADINQRYLAYRRISALSAADEPQHADLKDEITDRYGRLPAETDTLFQVMALKKDLIALRISKLEKGKDTLVFTFQDNTPASPERILAYLQGAGGAARLTPDGKLIVQAKLDSIEAIFTTARKTLTSLLS
ncbi:MAG: transcription-repair coupling factor [Desulfocapsaceae bacterium]|nr:transcription-repair coupling factor [Desulfocapsaceae bacterium]